LTRLEQLQDYRMRAKLEREMQKDLKVKVNQPGNRSLEKDYYNNGRVNFLDSSNELSINLNNGHSYSRNLNAGAGSRF
jgi:hypothetical protein